METLLNLYDPEIEIVWAGERKPFDMPERFRGHSETLNSFDVMHQFASSGIDADFLPVEFLDAGGPCFAVRLHMVGKWSRSTTPIQQGVSTVYTLARGRILRQILIFDDRVDLAEELAEALDLAGASVG